MKRSQEPGHGIEHGGFRRPIEASVCVGSERITGDEAVASEAAGVSAVRTRLVSIATPASVSA
ncbi:hypothetical protein [Sphingomonas bacterium]|uniref:hypothetical protein n=1 Tax=Sphingomonas bacterium TaxID=1895847 RepID=UPI0015769019|nr:hypothetical protein [Sphingomonas bacterium]